MKSVLELLASENLDTEGPHLITADELRAAGAFDVPPSWRKSLSAGTERDLFTGLFADDDPLPEDEQPAPCDGDDDALADEERTA